MNLETPLLFLNGVLFIKIKLLCKLKEALNPSCLKMANTTSICNSILIGRLVIFFCDNLYVKKTTMACSAKFV